MEDPSLFRDRSDALVLSTVDDLLLQLGAQVGEIGAVARHTDDQVAVLLRILLGLQQRLTVDDGKLNVPQLQIDEGADELHQVISNLVDNAVKYSNGGDVSVSLVREEETVVLSVADNGPGIPEEDLDRIFERFYRVDKARSREAGGTGLGLAIVSDTVRRRGGSVSAANRAGGGAVFTVKWEVADI